MAEAVCSSHDAIAFIVSNMSPQPVYNASVPSGGDPLRVDVNTQYEEFEWNYTYIVLCGFIVWLIIPGIGLLYSGLARRKSALALLFQSFMIVAVWVCLFYSRAGSVYSIYWLKSSRTTFQWMFWGYSLAYARDGGPFIGNLKNFGLKSIMAAPSPGSAVLPEIVFCFYQLLFCACTVSSTISMFCSWSDRYHSRFIQRVQIYWLPGMILGDDCRRRRIWTRQYASLIDLQLLLGDCCILSCSILDLEQQWVALQFTFFRLCRRRSCAYRIGLVRTCICPCFRKTKAFGWNFQFAWETTQHYIGLSGNDLDLVWLVWFQRMSSRSIFTAIFWLICVHY